MFANFRKLNRENILLWAKQAGLEMVRFTKDLDSAESKAIVTREINEGVNAGVNGTPTFFINGKHYNGQVEVEQLKPILEAELKGR